MSQAIENASFFAEKLQGVSTQTRKKYQQIVSTALMMISSNNFWVQFDDEACTFMN